MGPSEQTIEARLSALRRRREAIDREIADLLLYLELGRRLSGVETPLTHDTPPTSRGTEADAPARDDRDRPRPTAHGADTTRRDPSAVAPSRDHAPAASTPADPLHMSGPATRGRRSQSPPAPDPARTRPVGGTRPPAVAFAEDPTAARRYGRALVEAACAVIAQAGRPLHAGEILERLVARGFTVPGRDPVAALNTRLWKRATPDGPLRRLGEASYALADGHDGDTGFGDTGSGAGQG